jgi:hypothetical protein
MDFASAAANLLSPPVLFFALGLIAAWLRSDLDLPQPIPKLLSLFLLLAIGLKGGHQLHDSGLSLSAGLTLGVAVAMAFATPLYCFAILRRKFDVPNAAAIAATYGSISAITFITASNFLDRQQVPFGGHMVAAMALMESPAIVVAVLLARLYGAKPPADSTNRGGVRWGKLLHEAFVNGPVLLLVGSLIIGLVADANAMKTLYPQVNNLFTVALPLFLLDMGLVAGRQLRALKAGGAFLPAFALGVPLVNAAVAIVVAKALGLTPGDALLLTTLFASASYIAVPAAVRLAIPEANPSFYVPMALAITFPFNVVAGIPLYWAVVRAWWGS